MEAPSIDDYEIIRTLGQGTTAKVKLARNRNTDQHVAIKIIKKSLFAVKTDLERKIRREIALMKLMDHPHLLKLINVFESQRHIQIVMEYAENGELFDYLVSRSKLGVNEAMDFFRQLIYALEYLQSNAICHRDLKPENILLDRSNHLKIADFGFARWMQNDVAETSCGSPHYAAPEVIRGEVYDGRGADIWSCGVILYALLAGKLPFDDPSIRNLLSKIKSGHFVMPSFFPEDVQNLISRMLTVDTKSRITISEIKSHPAFSINVPPGYKFPTPLPLPNISTPVPDDQITDDILKIYENLGYSDRNEVLGDLKKPETTIAKVFFCMMTSNLDIESLPWGQQVSGQPISSDEFIVDNQDFQPGFVAHTNDVFFRKPKPHSFGSPDMYSFAEQAEWASVDVGEPQYAQVQDFTSIESSITNLMFAFQKKMDEAGNSYFYPNDTTLIIRSYDSETYCVLQVIPSTEQLLNAKLQKVKGSDDFFENTIEQIRTAIIALTE